MLPQDAVAGMPVQNKAIPDDNGIQQPSFVENVLLKLLFFFKIQGRDLALKFWSILSAFRFIIEMASLPFLPPGVGGASSPMPDTAST